MRKKPLLLLLGALIGILFTAGCGTQAPARISCVAPTYGAGATYLVKPKDTLHSIARETGVNDVTLVRLNKIEPPYTIYAGQRLLLKERAAIGQSNTSVIGSVLAKNNANVTGSNFNDNSTSSDITCSKAPVAKITSVPGGGKAENNNFTADDHFQQMPSSGTSATDNSQAINSQRTNLQHYTPSTSNPPKPSAALLAAQRGNLHWNWPVRGPILGRFATGSAKKKNGVDIGGREGLAIKAAAPGKVVYSGSGLRGYGNLIIIKHANNFLSAYAHNRKNIVPEGTEVKTGQTIAEMGNTGVNKTMLHFEIRHNGTPVDPEKLLPRK